MLDRDGAGGNLTVVVVKDEEFPLVKGDVITASNWTKLPSALRNHLFRENWQPDAEEGVSGDTDDESVAEEEAVVDPSAVSRPPIPEEVKKQRKLEKKKRQAANRSEQAEKNRQRAGGKK